MRFTTSAGVHGGTLAEFAVFGVLAGAKDLPRLLELQARREWPGRWAMRQVSEQTVLVVGLGGIGQQTATLLKGLGARVLGVKRTAEPVENVDEVARHRRSAGAGARSATRSSSPCPAPPRPTGLIGREVLQAAKPGVVVVNVGRGTTIDEPALIDALRSGQVSSAYLDVFATEPLPTESPLWSMRNVVIAPHTAALNPAEDRRIAELFAGQPPPISGRQAAAEPGGHQGLLLEPSADQNNDRWPSCRDPAGEHCYRRTTSADCRPGRTAPLSPGTPRTGLSRPESS